MLNFFTFFPNFILFVLFSLLSLLVVRDYNYRSVRSHFFFVYIISAVLFVFTSFLLLNYSNELAYGFLGIANSGVGDGLSVTLIWLTSFIVGLCVVYNYNVVGFAYAKTNYLLISMAGLLILCFSALDLLSFYVYFEGVVIPMLIIVSLGSRGRKIHAAFLFFFYTFASSLFLLTGIVFVYYYTGTLCFAALHSVNFISNEQQVFIFFLFFVGFAAKIPLVPLHIWLPEAHVEAPTVGSVLLAGILLKLGAYGMYRVIVPLCTGATLSYVKPVVVIFLLVSLVYSALTALRQIDLKKLVAYSSVVHMSFSLFGLFSVDFWGIKGFLFLLLSHGFISSAMFFCVGILYDRFHVRNILYFGGLVQYMPLFGIFYFVIMFSNLSLPGTCNFIGEFLVIFSLLENIGILPFTIVLFGLSITVIFCLILLYRVLFYQSTGFLTINLVDLTYFEFLILLVLVFYMILFGILPNRILGIFL